LALFLVIEEESSGDRSRMMRPPALMMMLMMNSNNNLLLLPHCKPFTLTTMQAKCTASQNLLFHLFKVPALLKISAPEYFCRKFPSRSTQA